MNSSHRGRVPSLFTSLIWIGFPVSFVPSLPSTHSLWTLLCAYRLRRISQAWRKWIPGALAHPVLRREREFPVDVMKVCILNIPTNKFGSKNWTESYQKVDQISQYYKFLKKKGTIFVLHCNKIAKISELSTQRSVVFNVRQQEHIGMWRIGHEGHLPQPAKGHFAVSGCHQESSREWKRETRSASELLNKV